MNQIKHALTAYALVIVCALAGTQTANAQIFRWGWGWQRCQSCQTRSACSACKTTAAESCETCSGESCETCSDCPLSALESELVKEAIRVRGRHARILKFDLSCNRRAQYNTICQSTYCQLGHYTGDCNEIAGVGYTSARAAIAGWLNSPQHRAILLRGNYTRVGACVRRGRDGRLYWTMNFAY